MLSFRNLGLAINDRQNWPVIISAGAAVFLGSQIFEALGVESAVWTIALIFVISLAARPYVKMSRYD